MAKGKYQEIVFTPKKIEESEGVFTVTDTKQFRFLVPAKATKTPLKSNVTVRAQVDPAELAKLSASQKEGGDPVRVHKILGPLQIDGGKRVPTREGKAA